MGRTINHGHWSSPRKGRVQIVNKPGASDAGGSTSGTRLSPVTGTHAMIHMDLKAVSSGAERLAARHALEDPAGIDEFHCAGTAALSLGECGGRYVSPNRQYDATGKQGSLQSGEKRAGGGSGHSLLHSTTTRGEVQGSLQSDVGRLGTWGNPRVQVPAR